MANFQQMFKVTNIRKRVLAASRLVEDEVLCLKVWIG